MRKALFSLVLFVASASTLLGQLSEQGLYPGISYDSDILGNVNLTTGSVAIDHSLLSLPQWKGISIGDMALTYNSLVWSLDISCDPENEDECTAQWLPSSNTSGSVTTSPNQIMSWSATPILNSNSLPYAWQFQATTSDSTPHTLVPYGNGYRSIDGSGIFLNSTGTQLKDSSGTTYTYTVPGGNLIPTTYQWPTLWPSSLSYPVAVENVHGQSIVYANGEGGTSSGTPGIGNYVYSANPDTLGRNWIYQETSDYTGCSGPVAIGDAYIYFLQDAQGNKHPIFKTCLVAIPLATAFDWCHGVDQNPPSCDYSDMGSQLPGFLQSVVFTPDGTWSSSNAWTFLYGSTDFSSSNYVNYGVLTGIQTPQGATVTYNWQIVGNQGEGINMSDGLVVQSRTLNAGFGAANQTTTYAFNGYSTVVTNPDSTTVIHSFDLNLAETGTTFADANGNTTKTISKSYLEAFDPFQAALGVYPNLANAFLTGSTTTWPNGISCTTQQSYADVFYYSALNASYLSSTGEVGNTDTYDCATGSNGALLSVTTDSWVDQLNSSYSYSNANLIGLVQQESVFDGSNNLVSQTTYGYDQNGESSAVGDQTSAAPWLNTGGSLQLSSYYDSTGQPTRNIDPSGNTTTLGYDATDLVVTSANMPPVPSGATLQTSAAYDPFSYMMTSQTSVAGGTASQAYDEMFRPTSGTMANGGTFSYTYSPASSTQYATVTKTSQQDSRTTSSQTVLDGFGRTIQSNQQADGTNGPVWYQQDTCYDNMGRVSFQSYSYATQSSTPAAHSCSMNGDTYNYDALGRLVKTTHADGTYATVAYTGRATMTTDENGVSRISQVDGMGRLTTVCEISANSSMPGSGSPQSCGTDIAGTGFVTSYSYNLANHTTTITQGVQQRIFQTDSVGRPVYSYEPESGVTSFTYTYNNTGLSVVRQRPQANQQNAAASTHTTTQYDALGRVLTIAYDDGITANKQYDYDVLNSQQQWSISPTFTNGNLVDMTSGSGSTLTRAAFSYDVMGHVTTMWQCAPSICGTSSQASRPALQFGYDLVGNQTFEFDGASGGIVYGRSLAGEVTSVTNQNYVDQYNPPNIVSNVVNGPNGPLSYSLGNGLSVNRNYDALGRAAGGWVCSGSMVPGCTGGSQLYGYAVGYTGRHLAGACDTVINQCEGIAYDEFNRITAVSGPQSVSYTYDRYGNRWSQNASPGGPSPSYTFNTVNNQISGSGVIYDAAGNIINDGFHSYTFDAEGNIVAVDAGSTAQYVYDAMNRRVAIQTSSASAPGWEYTSPNQWEYIYDFAGRPISTWYVPQNFGNEGRIYWDDTQIAYRAWNGQTFYEHKDWLGTERLRTNYQGQVAESDYSLPFGDGFSATVDLSLGDQDSLYFGGLNHDSESSTEHAQFRQFSSTQGRWLAPDPYGGSYDAGNPQSFNRYAYALNNPLVLTDPSGLDVCTDDMDCYNDPGSGDSIWAAPNHGDGIWAAAPNHGDGPLQPPTQPAFDIPLVSLLLPGGSVPVDKHGEPIKQRNKKQPAPSNVVKHYGVTVPCSSSAGQVMGAVETNFAAFGNYSSGPFSLAFHSPAQVGVGSEIPITAGYFGFTQSMGVNVQSMSSSSMSFSTLPGGHLLYPAGITFSASSAGAGSINFNIDLAGNFNGLLNGAKYYLGGDAFENAQWNHFLSKVSAYCSLVP